MNRSLLWFPLLFVISILIPWMLLIVSFVFISSAYAADNECSWIEPYKYAVCAIDADGIYPFEESSRLYVSGDGTAYTADYDTNQVRKALVLSSDGSWVWTQDNAVRYLFPPVADWMCRPPELTSCPQ